MLREPLLIALFILCLAVSALFAAELWTGPKTITDENLAARIAIIDARLPNLRSDVLIHRQERAFITAQRRYIVELMGTRNDR